MSNAELRSKAAKHFGIDVHLLEAVERAEGGPDALLRAVRCSIPSCADYASALDIACRSICHALSDFLLPVHAEEIIPFLGNRWAPVGADNDPGGLNAHWVHNVLTIYKELTTHAH